MPSTVTPSVDFVITDSTTVVMNRTWNSSTVWQEVKSAATASYGLSGNR